MGYVLDMRSEVILRVERVPPIKHPPEQIVREGIQNFREERHIAPQVVTHGKRVQIAGSNISSCILDNCKRYDLSLVRINPLLSACSHYLGKVNRCIK